MQGRPKPCWGWQKSLENPERGNLLLWKRKASPGGCRPWAASSVLPGKSSSPDVPSQCILGRRPQAGLLSEAAEGGGRERSGSAGAPQIKMDAFADQPAQWHRLCRGARSHRAARLLGNQRGRLEQGAGTGWGRGRAHQRTISQLYYRHKEEDQSGAGVTFWCFMKAVNWCGNILVLIKEKKASEGEGKRQTQINVAVEHF